MFTGGVVTPFEAFAAEALFSRQAREPVQQFVGGAFGLLLQQPDHQVGQGQGVLAAFEHFLDCARRARCRALVGLVRLGEARRLGLEAGQGIDVGLDLAGAAEEGALRTGEHRHRRLWHGVDALAADHRKGEGGATGHGVMPARFFAQRQQQLAGVTQGQLGAGLHLEDARVGAQQHVVIDQVTESRLFAEQAQQHGLDLAHALLESAVGVDQLDHRLDVLVPGRQDLGIALTQGDLAVAGLGPFGHGDQRLLVVVELLEDVAHTHVEQAQLARQIVAVAVVEGVLDMPGQPLQVAQVGFDFQAQAQAVFAAQVGEEVVDLGVELETVLAFRHRHQDVQADPHIE